MSAGPVDPLTARIAADLERGQAEGVRIAAQLESETKRRLMLDPLLRARVTIACQATGSTHPEAIRLAALAIVVAEHYDGTGWHGL